MRNRKHDIERYLRGELTSAEMHALEKEALHDPFLAEALEGVEHAGADNFLYDLHRLNQSVHKRTRSRKDRTIQMWGWIAGVAATIMLVCVSGFLVINLLNAQRRYQQALRAEEKSLMETTASRDTLTVVFPPESIAEAGKRKEPPSVSGRETPVNESPRTQSPSQEITLEQEALVAEQDPPTKAHDTVAASETASDLEDEPVTLADIARAETSPEEKNTSDDPVLSKKSQGRAAGARAERAAPSVTRAESAKVILLRGKVTSATDGEGLPGVNVMLKGSNTHTVTDGLGNYELSVPAENSTLVFSFIGFKSHTVEVGEKQELNAALEEDATSLSEVVVVSGYGAAHDSDKATPFRPAAPRGGKSDFKEYLNRSVRYPEEAQAHKAEGRVTVRFTVQPDGQLTDFQVVRGIGFGCDEELIRAIQEGPAWQPATRGDVPLRDKVKVRYSFELR